jgi:hypothetical protein
MSSRELCIDIPAGAIIGTRPVAATASPAAATAAATSAVDLAACAGAAAVVTHDTSCCKLAEAFGRPSWKGRGDLA